MGIQQACCTEKRGRDPSDGNGELFSISALGLTIRVWEYRIEYQPYTYLDTFFVSFHCIWEQCICIGKVSIGMHRRYDTFFYFTLHAFSTTVKGKGFNYLSV